ncbi:CHASE2 domain-containing sensor protein [Nocardioides marinisabuli]|uniref:CHASE2 domain-containing sensor protein n=1 Tax=Nocardioides marinisabuli TaxID=419476 RepID=A0A7Y9EZ55_9ACTN|nr:hypothetical protein [Nocardioides marinisabuli]NYD56639.1 CHASE2 domain-containing sensor protein [Nocardioides marinisabuli]
MTTPQPATRPRRRHLIDPDNPPPPPSNASLGRVQQWVMSVLVTTTILHLSVGLVLAAWVIDQDDLVPVVGLEVIAGIFAVIAVGLARAIHRLPVLSPWLLLGVVPTLVGLVVTLT